MFHERAILLTQSLNSPQFILAKQIDPRPRLMRVEMGYEIALVRPDVWDFKLLHEQKAEGLCDGGDKVLKKMEVLPVCAEKIALLAFG